MVNPSVGEERETTPERLNSLCNFALRPVKWVSQRRTNAAAAVGAGVPVGGDRQSPLPESDDTKSIPIREPEPEKNQSANARVSKKNKKKIPTPRTDDGDGECGIEAVRQKLVIDLKISMDRMQEAIMKSEKEDERRESPPVEVARRWNLRTRRGESDKGKGLKIEEMKPNCSLRQRRNNSYDKKTERVKFRLELTKKEIEEDFMAVLGHLPPRKPNKRPKAVEKHLDNFFPGSQLTEVTTNLYKVTDSTKSKNSKGKAKDASL